MMTYLISAYNSSKCEYAHLGEQQAPTQQDALHDWALENPKKNKVIEAMPEVRVVAMLESGGI